jgi:hypothetical protein
MAMDTAFISDERDGDQCEHHDQDDVLFVFRKFENSEEAFHAFIDTVSVMLSEAKHL